MSFNPIQSFSEHTFTDTICRSLYDLPPSVIAKPLPARDPNTKSKSKATGKNKKEEQAKQARKYETKRKADHDDTPRAFRHLMQLQERAKQQKQQQPSSKTDGTEGSKKKRKRDTEDGHDESTPKKKSGGASTASAATDAAAKTGSQTAPKILPGEKLSDFAARVDREMPLSEMKRSSHAPAGDLPKIREQRLTKHDKRLRRLQAQWREEDVKIREREQAEREEREAEMEDQLELWKQWETEAGKTKAKKAEAQKKKKKNRGNAAAGDSDDDDDPDPWAKLNNPERMNRQINPLDVAQAPPQLTKPREIFKVRGGAKVNVANVPAAVGSLRRREELADERKNIVEEYRRLMAEKRQ